MKFWSWGANSAGQLGLGFASEQVSRPTEMNILDSLGARPQRILSVGGGGCHILILGLNKCDDSDSESSFHAVSVIHHLGHVPSTLQPFTIQIHRPQQYFPSMLENDGEYQQISCGWDFNIFLDSFGDLYTSGENTFGQLGRKVPDVISNEISKIIPMTFEPIEFENKTKFISISAGMRHAAAIERDQIINGFGLYTWGDNSKGQLGHVHCQDSNYKSKIISKPTKVELDFGIQKNKSEMRYPIKVRCTKHTTIFLTNTGHFYAAGLNKFGIFGEQFSKHRNIVSNFVQLSFETRHKVKDFQCGWNHVLVLLENGQVLSWGRNNFGQLGRKIYQKSEEDFDCIPGQVEELPEPIHSIRCGTEHNLALGESGKIYSWGWNEHDNCGVRGSVGEFIPIPTVVPFPATEKVILIGCGAGNGFAVSESLK